MSSGGSGQPGAVDSLSRMAGVTKMKSPRGAELFEVRSRPAEGFHWDYYLLVPKGWSRGGPQGNSSGTGDGNGPASTAGLSSHLLVAPNNSGTNSDDMALHAERARELLRRVHRWLGRELGTPCLVPVFPRPRTIEGAPREGWFYYTHALDRQSLGLEVEEYERIDRQLIAMIDHARSLLSKTGRRVEPEVLMFGFSASGNYANRFAFLHPGRVQAIAAGGLNGMPLLPLDRMAGRKLYYPVGIYDVEELTGDTVDLEAVRRTPQYLFMGELDANDTLPYDDAFDDRERRIIEEVFATVPVREPSEEKASILLERFELSSELYRRMEIPARFEVYEGIGHTLNGDVVADIIEFYEESVEVEAEE